MNLVNHLNFKKKLTERGFEVLFVVEKAFFMMHILELLDIFWLTQS